MDETKPAASRRHFLKNSTATAIGASVLGQLVVPSRVHAANDETIKVGAIGLGGRGAGAVVNALGADPNTKLVAVGDAFEDRLRSSLDRLKKHGQVGDRVTVDDDHAFWGFDAYKKVIDSDIDVVCLTTPPHFRPAHLKYAVDAGKHCFVEKPIAVDAPGVRSVIATCETAAEKGLSIVSGLCWRYDKGVLATMERIQDGAIGDIVAVQSSYNTGLLWHRGDKPNWSRMEYQMRNWLYYTWLSGDHIGEQAVHSIDKTGWLMGDTQPLRAVGLGGRQQRTGEEYGHIFDHHAVVYEYPNNVRVFLYTRQQEGCKNHVDEFVMGTKGQAEILAHKIQGETNWRYPERRKKSMYDLEHDAFFASIRNGEPINNGHYMCNSTMLAVMGRLCTYTGKELTWEQAFNSQERLGPETYEWGDVPEPVVAIPGQTEFV
jgi:predicted dehydrogenase